MICRGKHIRHRPSTVDNRFERKAVGYWEVHFGHNVPYDVHKNIIPGMASYPYPGLSVSSRHFPRKFSSHVLIVSLHPMRKIVRPHYLEPLQLPEGDALSLLAGASLAAPLSPLHEPLPLLSQPPAKRLVPARRPAMLSPARNFLNSCESIVRLLSLIG